MDRIRVLMVSHNFSLTGAPIVLMHLAVQLKERFEVLVVSPSEGPLRLHLVNNGVQALVVANVVNDINVVGGLLLSYDIVIANTLLGFVAIHAAKQMKKPSIWYVHEGTTGNFFLQKFAPAMPAAMQLATRFVAPCKFVSSFYAPLRRGPTELIAYGVGPAATVADQQTTATTHVLQLGSIEPRKGQDISCAAMRLLKKANVTLDFVGAVDDPGFAQTMAAQSSDLPQIKWRGPSDMGQIPRLIAECDFLITPSRDEVTPMVILEAMAMGKAVIAAAVGGVPEMIQDRRTGFLIPPNNPAALAERIDELAGNTDLRRTVGLQGQQFVRSERTLEQFGEAFSKLVKMLVTNYPTG